jgi:hypothetical protein
VNETATDRERCIDVAAIGKAAAAAERERCAGVFALRRACWQNGYRPLAVYSVAAKFQGKPIEGAGKRPVTTDWLKQALQDPPWVVSDPGHVTSLALNTGLLTGELSGLDVDVTIQDVADQIVSRIEQTLGPTPLSRIGNPPKILLCYRAVEPFTKLSTPHYRMLNGSSGQFEILGTGQHAVAFGVQPGTCQPYQWLDRSPADTPLAELPEITVMQARELIGEAAAILEAAGGVAIHPDEPKPVKSRGAAELNGSGDQDATESPASGRARPPGGHPRTKHDNKRGKRVLNKATFDYSRLGLGYPSFGIGAPKAKRSFFGIVRNEPHQNPAGAVFQEGYLLAIVEFDDQGVCYDRSQMRAFSGILERLKGLKPLVLVFVHGWSHDARSDDANLTAFRAILHQAGMDAPDRPVLGVFVGWRGMSWHGLLTDYPSFFGRKQAALRIALGSVRELLGRLRRFRNDESSAFLIIMGHSFGGLIVFSSVAQSLTEAAVMPPGTLVPSFADLVILLNPAFEAARYLPVFEQVDGRNDFAPNQPPVFISITAENDSATGFWFPIGMRLAARGETTCGPRERTALIRTMGHIDWMRTHDLSKPGEITPARKQAMRRPGDAPVWVAPVVSPTQSAPRSETITYASGACLRTVPGFCRTNPFWVVRASAEVIDQHSGIHGYVLSDFVRDLVIGRMNDGVGA